MPGTAPRAARSGPPALAACLALLAGCSYSPDVPGGEQRCSTDGRCPSGLSCSSDGFCWATGHAPPGAPADVAAAGGLRQIRVSWSEPPTNGGGAITRYLVAGNQVGGSGALAAEPTDTAWTFTGLPDGVSYRFVVVAVNRSGTSAASALSDAATTFDVPGAPTGLVATGGVRSADLDWTAPALTGGAPITGYQITQSLGGAAAEPSTFALAGTHAQVLGLKDGGSYVFTVRAVNVAGAGPASAPSPAVALVDLPAAPVISAPAWVTEGASNVIATVPAVAGVTFAWTLTGATITSVNGSAGFTSGGINKIAFTVNDPAGGQVTYGCVASTAAGPAPAATASSSIVPSPVTPAITMAAYFTAGDTGRAAAVSARAGMTYAWTISGATLTSPPAGVTAGGINAATFDLTAGEGGLVVVGVTERNAAGVAGAAARATATVVGAPGTPAISAPTDVRVGSAGIAASVPARGGMTYEWVALSGGVLSSPIGGSTGGGVNTATFAATGPSGSALAIQVTEVSLAGLRGAPARASINLLAVPAAPVISAPAFALQGATALTASIDPGAGLAYAWTVGGGGALRGPAGGTSISFDATGAIGSTVTLSCVAADAVGTSPPGTRSVPVVGLPAAPAAPAVTAGPGRGALTVSWAASSGNGLPVTGYTVGGAQVGGGGLVSADATGTSATFTSLGDGATWSFLVRATSAAGSGAASPAAQGTTFDVPGPPTGVTVTPGDASAAVSWVAPAGDGGTPITGWLIFSNDGSGRIQAVTTPSPIPGNVNGATVTGLTNGASYTFEVVAQNAVGVSGYSPPSDPVTPQPPPTAPQIAAPAAVTEGRTGYAASVQPAGGVTYAWRSQPGGLITSDPTGPRITFKAPGAAGGGPILLTVTATKAAGSTPGARSVAVAAAPAPPRILPGASEYTAGAAGRIARAPRRPGMTYLWSATNAVPVGELRPGDPGWDPDWSAWVFDVQAPALPGSALLSCTERNAAGDVSDASFAEVPLRGPVVAAAGAPADGAVKQSWLPAAWFWFDRAPDAATLLGPDGTGSCATATVQLSKDGFATCAPLALSPRPGGTVFDLTPAAALEGDTVYQLRVTTAVRDDQGVPLAAPLSTSFRTHQRPGQVSLSWAPRLSSIDLRWAWTPADQAALCDVGCAGVQVRARLSGSPDWSPVGGLVAGGHLHVVALEPGRPHDLELVTVDADGAASLASELAAVPLRLTGFADDFEPAQQLDDRTGTRFSLTWSRDLLFAAAGGVTGERKLRDGRDLLWVAIDTDPADDRSGEDRLALPVSGKPLIWPFRADRVVQLAPSGPVTYVLMHSAGTPGFHRIREQPVLSKDGALAELAIPAAALGGAGPLRIAFAVIDGATGAVLAGAPIDPDPSVGDLVAQGRPLISLPDALAPLANAFDVAKAAQAASPAVSPLVQAAGLVRFRLEPAGGGSLPLLRGSIPPLTYDLDGDGRIAGVAMSSAFPGAPIAETAINFGADAAGQELLFKFADAAALPPRGEGPGGGWPDGPDGSGVDRVWTLSGSAETLPLLQYGVAWSASHVPQLELRVCTGGSPTSIAGNLPELAGFASGGGLPVADTGVPCGGGARIWTAWWPPAGAPAYDFTTPLAGYPIPGMAWRVIYGGAGAEGGSDHLMNDDVINRRVLGWTAGDAKSF